MPAAYKKTIAIAVSLVCIGIAYYGSYLPYRKSTTFIATLRAQNQIKSLEDFQKAFSKPLDLTSPIGQEELVRNTANVVLGVVQQNTNPAVIAQILEYLRGYYKPILARESGMSMGQDLYLLGAMYELAFLQTQDVKYLIDAAQFFERGVMLGPSRPQSLYGLFDVYRMGGDNKKAVEVGNRILSLWPQDDKLRSFVEELKKQVVAESRQQ